MASNVVGNLKTLLTADSSQFEATLTKAAKRGHVFAMTVNASFGAVTKVVDFATARVKQFGDYVWEGAKLAGEGQQKTASLALALKQVKDAGSFELNGQKGLAAFVSLADELEEATGESAESVLDLQAQFARTGASSKDIEKATRAALDMAVAMGQSPVTAARKMIGATKGATEGLARFGVEMSQIEKGAKKSLGKVAEEIDNAFAGAAEKKAHTFAGRLAAISNASENLQKEFGGVVVRNKAFNTAMEVARKAIDRVRVIVADLGPDMGRAFTYALGVATTAIGWFISAAADTVDWATKVYGSYRVIGAGMIMFSSKVAAVIASTFAEALKNASNAIGAVAGVLEDSWLPAARVLGAGYRKAAEGLGVFADKAGAVAKKTEEFSKRAAGAVKTELADAEEREAAIKRSTDKFRAMGETIGMAGEAMRDAARAGGELEDTLEAGTGKKEPPVDPDKLKEAAKALRDLVSAGNPFWEFSARQSDKLQEWNDKLQEGVITAEQHRAAIAAIDKAGADESARLMREQTKKISEYESYLTDHKKAELDKRLEQIAEAGDAEIEKQRALLEGRLISEQEFARRRAQIDAAMREKQQIAVEEQQAEYARAGVQFAQALAGGIKSYMDSKDPKDLFKGLLQGLIGVLPMIMAAAGAGPLALALVPGMLGVGAGFMHAGGKVQGRGSPRRFHGGGSPSAGEVDTRLQVGEGVLSRASMARIGPEAFHALANGYGTPAAAGPAVVQNIVAFDAPSYAGSVDRVGDRVSVQRVGDRRGAEAREAVQRAAKPGRYF